MYLLTIHLKSWIINLSFISILFWYIWEYLGLFWHISGLDGIKLTKINKHLGRHALVLHIKPWRYCYQNPNSTTTQPNISKVGVDMKITIYHHNHHHSPTTNNLHAPPTQWWQYLHWYTSNFDQTATVVLSLDHNDFEYNLGHKYFLDPEFFLH